jgi:hypothetical protein
MNCTAIFIVHFDKHLVKGESRWLKKSRTSSTSKKAVTNRDAHRSLGKRLWPWEREVEVG